MNEVSKLGYLDQNNNFIPQKISAVDALLKDGTDIETAVSNLEASTSNIENNITILQDNSSKIEGIKRIATTYADLGLNPETDGFPELCVALYEKRDKFYMAMLSYFSHYPKLYEDIQSSYKVDNVTALGFGVLTITPAFLPIVGNGTSNWDEEILVDGLTGSFNIDIKGHYNANKKLVDTDDVKNFASFSPCTILSHVSLAPILWFAKGNIARDALLDTLIFRTATNRTAYTFEELGLDPMTATLQDLGTALNAGVNTQSAPNRDIMEVSIGVNSTMEIWKCLPQVGTEGHLYIRRESPSGSRLNLEYRAGIHSTITRRYFANWAGPSVNGLAWECVVLMTDYIVRPTEEGDADTKDGEDTSKPEVFGVEISTSATASMGNRLIINSDESRNTTVLSSHNNFIIHAGDNANRIVNTETNTPVIGGEHVMLMADNEVRIYTGIQAFQPDSADPNRNELTDFNAYEPSIQVPYSSTPNMNNPKNQAVRFATIPMVRTSTFPANTLVPLITEEIGTPALKVVTSPTTGTATFSSAFYINRGDMVTVRAILSNPSGNTGGIIEITGLPFPMEDKTLHCTGTFTNTGENTDNGFVVRYGTSQSFRLKHAITGKYLTYTDLPHAVDIFVEYRVK